MKFGESITTVFSKYAIFKGRASRSEFWWWSLFVFVISFLTSLIDIQLELEFNYFTFIFSLVSFLPNLSVTVRRCHDSNHSGWWAICPIVNLVMIFLPSKQD